MVSRAARSRSTSRSSSFNPRVEDLSNTRSSGPVPQRAYRRLQSSIEFPQEHQSSGVCDATSNQRWQTRRKLYEPFTSPPKSPSGMAFHPKMLLSISGGRRVDTFNSKTRTSRADHSIAVSKEECDLPFPDSLSAGHGNHILRNCHLLP